MLDLRKIAIIFIIAVLYAILVQATIGAFYLSPEYDDFCRTKFYGERPLAVSDKSECPDYKQPTLQELEQCAEQRGFADYTYDANNCPIAYKGCNLCQNEYDAAREEYNLYVFIISSILALVGIAVGLYLPAKQDLNQWLATGFMLGGLISLFFGTMRYYEYLGRYLRPIVILIELIIVIYLAYKKLQK